ncbi:hypothetical protein ElyMa_001604400 [Elysia marginata]|uniref:Uncharacterized protein n=1 Tax=Elysia marginata TaxID=1093978 RepID=A0AAV4JMV2_9GAST|nr:hypothetical protein ElyMa_001604400 [Elysia marginata]
MERCTHLEKDSVIKSKRKRKRVGERDWKGREKCGWDDDDGGDDAEDDAAADDEDDDDEEEDDADDGMRMRLQLIEILIYSAKSHRRNFTYSVAHFPTQINFFSNFEVVFCCNIKHGWG